jgi:N-ethylmaleimide reductase
MEVVGAVSEIWGPDRVGVRLSPLGNFNDMSDAEPEVTFGTITEVLSDLRFAYLHVVNPGLAAIEKGNAPNAGAEQLLALIRQKYRGTLIVAGGFDRDTAEAWLEQGKADLIAFGRKFLANPDLPDRLRMPTRLNADDRSTYYGGGAKGYTDYPSLAQERGEQPKACVDDRWR